MDPSSAITYHISHLSLNLYIVSTTKNIIEGMIFQHIHSREFYRLFYVVCESMMRMRLLLPLLVIIFATEVLSYSINDGRNNGAPFTGITTTSMSPTTYAYSSSKIRGSTINAASYSRHSRLQLLVPSSLQSKKRDATTKLCAGLFGIDLGIDLGAVIGLGISLYIFSQVDDNESKHSDQLVKSSGSSERRVDQQQQGSLAFVAINNPRPPLVPPPRPPNYNNRGVEMNLQYAIQMNQYISKQQQDLPNMSFMTQHRRSFDELSDSRAIRNTKKTMENIGKYSDLFSRPSSTTGDSSLMERKYVTSKIIKSKSAATIIDTVKDSLTKKDSSERLSSLSSSPIKNNNIKITQKAVRKYSDVFSKRKEMIKQRLSKLDTTKKLLSIPTPPKELPPNDALLESTDDNIIEQPSAMIEPVIVSTEEGLVESKFSTIAVPPSKTNLSTDLGSPSADADMIKKKSEGTVQNVSTTNSLLTSISSTSNTIPSRVNKVKVYGMSSSGGGYLDNLTKGSKSVSRSYPSRSEVYQRYNLPKFPLAAPSSTTEQTSTIIVSDIGSRQPDVDVTKERMSYLPSKRCYKIPSSIGMTNGGYLNKLEISSKISETKYSIQDSAKSSTTSDLLESDSVENETSLFSTQPSSQQFDSTKQAGLTDDEKDTDISERSQVEYSTISNLESILLSEQINPLTSYISSQPEMMSSSITEGSITKPFKKSSWMPSNKGFNKSVNSGINPGLSYLDNVSSELSDNSDSEPKVQDTRSWPYQDESLSLVDPSMDNDRLDTNSQQSDNSDESVSEAASSDSNFSGGSYLQSLSG